MKRFCLFFVFFVMLFSVVALGEEPKTSEGSVEIIETNMDGTPRYTYLGSITIGLNIDESGHITYSGSARTSGYDLRINLYLQCSGNGFLWDDLECYINTGRDFVSSGGSRTVPENELFYRAEIVVEVLDSNRNVLETATAYSSEERY